MNNKKITKNVNKSISRRREVMKEYVRYLEVLRKVKNGTLESGNKEAVKTRTK